MDANSPSPSHQHPCARQCPCNHASDQQPAAGTAKHPYTYNDRHHDSQHHRNQYADHITYVEQHHVAHDHLAHKLAHFNSDDEPDLHTHFDHDSHIDCHHNTNI